MSRNAARQTDRRQLPLPEVHQALSLQSGLQGLQRHLDQHLKSGSSCSSAGPAAPSSLHSTAVTTQYASLQASPPDTRGMFTTLQGLRPRWAYWGRSRMQQRVACLHHSAQDGWGAAPDRRLHGLGGCRGRQVAQTSLPAGSSSGLVGACGRRCKPAAAAPAGKLLLLKVRRAGWLVHSPLIILVLLLLAPAHSQKCPAGWGVATRQGQPDMTRRRAIKRLFHPWPAARKTQEPLPGPPSSRPRAPRLQRQVSLRSRRLPQGWRGMLPVQGLECAGSRRSLPGGRRCLCARRKATAPASIYRGSPARSAAQQ